MGHNILEDQDNSNSFDGSKESGFTMLEMAIVLIISGLVLVTMVNAYITWNYILKSSQTKETLAVVSDALSAYASRNFRIPCPADPSGGGVEPFGKERGSGANGSAIGSCAAAGETEGIIPFASLGISGDFAVDGWGNYITYQVTPAFTRDPEDDIDVHVKCRTTDWIEGVFFTGTVLDGGRNIAPLKARFCCMVPPVAASQTNIFTTAAADTPADLPAIIFNGDTLDWYDDVDVVADHNNSSDPVADGTGQPFYNERIYGGGIDGVSAHTDLVTYALISHGSNGAGAYIGNGTTDRTPDDGGVSEQTNADDATQNIYDLEHNDSNGNAYYDDIVFWQTQSNLMARLRRDSCAVP